MFFVILLGVIMLKKNSIKLPITISRNERDYLFNLINYNATLIIKDNDFENRTYSIPIKDTIPTEKIKKLIEHNVFVAKMGIDGLDMYGINSQVLDHYIRPSTGYIKKDTYAMTEIKELTPKEQDLLKQNSKLLSVDSEQIMQDLYVSGTERIPYKAYLLETPELKQPVMFNDKHQLVSIDMDFDSDKIISKQIENKPLERPKSCFI